MSAAPALAPAPVSIAGRFSIEPEGEGLVTVAYSDDVEPCEFRPFVPAGELEHCDWEDGWTFETWRVS